MSSLKLKFFYQLAVSFLYSIAPILVFPYISRTLGPENIGKINFIEYSAQIFIIIATFGIPLYGVRAIAKVRDDQSKVNALASELIYLQLLTSILSSLLFIAFVFLNQSLFSETGLVIIAVSGLLINAFTIGWLIEGIEEFGYIAKRSYFIKIASVLAIFFFIRDANDYKTYYFILVLTNGVLIITDLFYIFFKGVRVIGAFNLKQHVKPLFFFFIASVAISLYRKFDAVLLGILSGTLAVGIYSTAFKTVLFSQNFISDLGGILLPRMSYLVRNGTKAEIDRILNKSLLYVLTFGIPVFLFILIMSPAIIDLLGGAAFSKAIPVLQILALYPLILGIENVFYIQVLLPFEREKYILFSAIVGSVLSIGLNLLLIPIFAEKGAAIACLIAELSVTVIMGIRATRLVSFRTSGLQVAGIIVSSLTFIPINLLTQQFVSNTLLQFIVVAFLCALIYFLIQFFVFKSSMMKEILAAFLKLIKKSA